MVTSLTLRGHKIATICIAVLAIGIIAGLGTLLPRTVPLLLAYILPISLIAVVCGRVPIVATALLCTAASELTDAYVWNVREGTARDLVTLLALVSVGLFVHEFITKQRAEQSHLQALSDENANRIEVEEQLTLLIGNSALAILTITDSGVIVQANEAAQRMFGADAAGIGIVDRRADILIPSLSRVLARSVEGRSMQAMMQAQGVRLDGEPFLADVWFSSYETSRGRRTSAMVVDVSEEFRTREESIADQLLSNSRLAVGAVTHELRNVFAAMQVVMQSLTPESPNLATDVNVIALRDMLTTLERVASVQLSSVRRSAARISLNQFMTEFRVVAQAILAEDDIAFAWEIQTDLPSVWADSEGLMQAFLNILRNSRKALSGQHAARVCISSQERGGHIEISITDNGPGVASPQALFQPFRAEGDVASLGLYLSRAILTSFRGDLRFQPSEKGAHFIVELEVAQS